MSKSLNDSLQQIARGTTIVFAGVIASMALNFIVRIALVRYTSQDEYGLYSLAITIVSMACIISTLGLDEGASRYIAYFLGKSEDEKARKVIFATLELALAASLLCSVILFLGSGFIASQVFHAAELSGTLQIISIALPFIVLIQALTSISRGFNISKMKVVFNDILKPLSFLILLAVIIVLGMGFEAIVIAYVVSMAVTLLAFIIYASRWYTQRYVPSPGTDRAIAKSLLQFSIPLFSVNMLLMMMSQATMLLLGFFKTPADVGKFDIAIMMGSLLLTVLNSLGYIYTPTVSNLYGKDQTEEMKRSYIVSTRWGYIGTLPILLVFLVFPEAIIDLLFGARYSDVALILQILTLGYMVNPITGPNYHTLIALGKTRVIIESFLVNAIINLALCVLLIPTFGIVGAAIAVSISVLVANTLLSVRLYQLLKIHPLTRNYILAIAVSLLLLGLTYFGLKYLAIEPSIYVAIICFVMYMIAFGALLIALKAIDKEDILILAAIEKKLGLHILPEPKIGLQ